MNGGDVGAVGSPLNGRLQLSFSYLSMIIGGFVIFRCLFNDENYAIMADKGLLHLVLITSYFTMWVMFWLTKSTNPGILEKQGRLASSNRFRKRVTHRVSSTLTQTLSDLTDSLESQYSEVLENMAKSSTERVQHFPELCHSCHIVKPLRAKHCRVMRRCVLVFDHYCPFVGNTIGMHNHSYFFFFLLSLATAISSTMVAVLVLYKRSGNIDLFSTLSTIYISLLFLPITLLLLTHITFFIQNLTSNEYENLKRYDHFWHNGRFVNPWNQGPLSNCYMRFFPTNKLYELPSSETNHEGLELNILERV